MSHRSLVLTPVLSLALLLTACGVEPPDAATGDDSVLPTAGTWTGTEDGAEACLLLGSPEIQEITGDTGEHWGADVNEWSYCRLLDHVGGTDTLDLQLLPASAFASLTGVTERGGARVLEADGRVIEVWLQAGGPRYGDDFLDATVGVRQTTGHFTDDEVIAIAETVAIAHENLDVEDFRRDGAPLTATDNDAAGDGGADAASPIDWTSELRAIRLAGTVESTGSAFSIEVTSADVIDAGNPATTMISCIGGIPDQSTGLVWEDQYIVQVLDQRITDGLRNAELVADEEVDGPGEYAAHLYLSEADGDSFELTGRITIETGMLSGTYDMQADGTSVTGGWECRT